MSFIYAGEQVVNLEMVSAAHWESDKLFVHLSGGRWVTFTGEAAKTIWHALEAAISSSGSVQQRECIRSDTLELSGQEKT